MDLNRTWYLQDTSDIQWYKLELVPEWRAILPLIAIPIAGCTAILSVNIDYGDIIWRNSSPCPHIVGNDRNTVELNFCLVKLERAETSLFDFGYNKHSTEYSEV